MRKHQFKLFIISITLAFQAVAIEYGNPSGLEQAHLEAINRSRANPLAEAERLGIDLFEGVPQGEISATPAQPLSFNVLLTDAARPHSQDMLFRNFFAHNNPDGQSPFDRITASGYFYRTAGENLALIGSSAQLDQQQTSLELHDNLFIDKDFPGRGHRVNMLAPEYREIGVGLAFGNWLQDGNILNAGVVTTDFGLRPDSLPILLGVTYDDLNQNQHYDADEGVADISVSFLQRNETTATASAGGYGVEMPSGNYLVIFDHENLGSLAKPVNLKQDNIKVDVLLSEFVQPTASSQCALFENNTLLVPCLSVGDSDYVLDFKLSKPEPLSFELDQLKSKSIVNSEQCASFNPLTEIAHFPCVTVGEQSYWADLSLSGANPISIQLLKAGIN